MWWVAITCHGDQSGAGQGEQGRGPEPKHPAQQLGANLLDLSAHLVEFGAHLEAELGDLLLAVIALTESSSPLRSEIPPRFLADAMLGRLARWLRVLGLDAAYDPSVRDPGLVSWARTEERILLTRDRPLLAEFRPQRALLIEADTPLAQLRQVVAELHLAPPVELFTRCLLCNAELRSASAEEADTFVPAASRVLPGPVRCCPACRRTYWPGSHARRMRAALARTFPEWRLV